jgi:Spy/CpxP family protein refolding chaperone
MRSRFLIPLGALLLSAASLAAQERLAPPNQAPDQTPPAAAQGRAPAVERLEALRYQRLQTVLGLSDEQTRALRRFVTANREALRQSIEREQAAVQALERTLASEPVDEEALARSLDAVEAAHADMERLRREQIDGLSRVLTPEQRARYLLFNRRFDARLRELIEERRGAAGVPGIRPRLRNRAPSDRRP